MVHLGRPIDRPVAAAVGALLAALLLAACNSPGSDDAADTETRQESSGPFFGECGAVTDDEVHDRLAVTAFDRITRDSVGCVWEVGGEQTPSVTFSWYRGSPIARERAGSELIGRPAEDIEIAGHPGFRGSGINALTGETVICEIGIEFGSDFQHWSVSYGATPPTADPCVVAQELAELSIGRAE